MKFEEVEEDEKKKINEIETYYKTHRGEMGLDV